MLPLVWGRWRGTRKVVCAVFEPVWVVSLSVRRY